MIKNGKCVGYGTPLIIVLGKRKEEFAYVIVIVIVILIMQLS